MKSKQRLRGQGDTVKQINVRIVGIPEEAERTFKEIMVKVTKLYEKHKHP